MDAPVLLSVRRIWNRGAHSAFTDLARFRGCWYCAFREAQGHAGSIGRIRILRSADGVSWRTAALLGARGMDLRDPKLSVAPGRKLMLLMGGARAGGTRSLVRISADGRAWSAPLTVLRDGEWLWRVTWHRGAAWGIAYRVESRRRWTVTLWRGRDAARFTRVSALSVPGLPNEATLRFLPDGSAAALVRREGGDRSAWIGISRSPFTRWRWKAAGHRIGGPNFIVLPSGAMWGAGRSYGPAGHRTVIARMTTNSWQPALELPSGGDCSYPGLVRHRGLLWVSYYSSHEGRAAIYLARIRP